MKQILAFVLFIYRTRGLIFCAGSCTLTHEVELRQHFVWTPFPVCVCDCVCDMCAQCVLSVCVCVFLTVTMCMCRVVQCMWCVVCVDSIPIRSVCVLRCAAVRSTVETECNVEARTVEGRKEAVCLFERKTKIKTNQKKRTQIYILCILYIVFYFNESLVVA